VEVAYLIDHPHLIPAATRWIWDAWPELRTVPTLDQEIADERAAMRRDGVPTTFIGMFEGRLAGRASLVGCDMTSRQDLTPWLSCVYVAPEYRRMGLASTLVERVAVEAERMGFEEVYLYTQDQQPLYRRLGWHSLEHAEYKSLRVTLMRRALTPSG
jgi:GNAT superfamily N-acetyltransferase